MSEENKKELLSSALELKRAYEELQAFPAWATIKAQLEKQVRVRTDRIMLTPLTNLDAAMEQEYAKGKWPVSVSSCASRSKRWRI